MHSRKPALFAALLAFVAVGSFAIAQNATTGRVFPYIGYLEENGFPVDGERDMEIRLFAGANQNNPCHTQPFDAVTVANGRFKVDVVDVPDACLINGELYAGISVGLVGGDLTDLSTGTGTGRVMIGAVPFAAASPKLSTFVSGEPVRIQTGTTNNSGLVSGKSLVVTGDFGDGTTSNGGVEFRHDNLSQGVGFGYQTIYATGSNNNQPLRVQSRGNSPLYLNVDNGGEVNVGKTLHVAGANAIKFDDLLGTKLDLWGGSYGLGIQNNTLHAFLPNSAVSRLGVGSAADIRTSLYADGDVDVGKNLAVTGNVAVAGNVNASGTVRWNCPSGMSRLGTNCIDDTIKASSNFGAALATCHSQGKDICSVDVLMACDELENQSVVINSDCVARTDQSGTFWTSGPAYDTYTGDVFDELAAYNGGDNSIDRTASTASRPFWCCVPGVRGTP